MTIHPDIEAILCATPPSIDIKNWFYFLPKVKFITCKPFKWIFNRPDNDLKKSIKKFSPDVIFIPVERSFKFNRIPIANMIQNMEPFTENISRNSFTDKCRLYIQCLVAKRAIEKSDRMIAVTCTRLAGHIESLLFQNILIVILAQIVHTSIINIYNRYLLKWMVKIIE
jgi:hypothetical protein